MRNETLSKKLRNLRESSGLSQGQIASKLYITRAAYSHYETGKRTPTIENLLQLSSLYKINPLELIELSLSKNQNNLYDLSEEKSSTNLICKSNKSDDFINNFNNLSQFDQELIIYMTKQLSKRNVN